MCGLGHSKRTRFMKLNPYLRISVQIRPSHNKVHEGLNLMCIGNQSWEERNWTMATCAKCSRGKCKSCKVT